MESPVVMLEFAAISAHSSQLDVEGPSSLPCLAIFLHLPRQTTGLMQFEPELEQTHQLIRRLESPSSEPVPPKWLHCAKTLLQEASRLRGELALELRRCEQQAALQSEAADTHIM